MQVIDQNEFWKHQQRFLKADLATEAIHPDSINLSQLCHSDLAQAFNCFRAVEVKAINALLPYCAQIEQLRNYLQMGLNNSNTRIFIAGCGSSGRLAMLIKRLFEAYYPSTNEKIIALSAGGDTSLIKSVEQFEDDPKLGVQQLLQQGFTPNDLLIGLSANGSAPFVTAMLEYAVNTAKMNPYFIFNNTKSSLQTIDPKHVCLNPKVNALPLEVGPMAITGSTRLQATTAMQIALSLALLSKQSIESEIKIISKIIEQLPLEKMQAISKLEGQSLQNEYVLYKAEDTFVSLSLLADITERAPTFNLIPFENSSDDSQANPSPFYFNLINSDNQNQVWLKLFGREVVCLNWNDFPDTTNQYINGFDLSNNSPRVKQLYLNKPQHDSLWLLQQDQLTITFKDQCVSFDLPSQLYFKALVYKVILNSHSTLMLGRLNYFEGNVMLFLNPSNYKLVDRAIRLSRLILEQNYKLNLSYEQVASQTFKLIDKLQANQSIVKLVVSNLCK
jgi:N-acetylmuramic acid 6-phosphate etherase